MGWLDEFRRRLSVLFRRERFDRELDEEMRFHLKVQAEENQERGMDAEEACHAARRQFENATLLKEVSRELWGWGSVERLGQGPVHTIRKVRGGCAMKRLVLCMSFALGVLAIVALPVGAEEKFGAGVTMKEVTPIESLMAAPETFVGKKVRVEGVVSAVCNGMGCWMELKDEQSGKSVQLKVDDGVIVFPVAAKGKKASGEGTFEKVDPAKEEHKMEGEKDPEHEKEMQNLKFRIKATGAIVY